MSDERDGAGSAGTPTDGDTGGTDENRGQTAVVTRPARPTGKRTRRAAVSDTDGADTEAAGADTDSGGSTNGSGKAKKTAKGESGGRVNPFAYIVTFVKQVIAELRKVIWPNRKQMVNYTIVVLVFLAFMVALISGVDYGAGRLIGLFFGE
ncbi:preprotein translocase subunit SecE [Mycolicibacterium sp. S2-37]|uniref:preprotein translocase subunit SecE n=1 Tax=Mycolicibacterium sp. S2-37 TaxID=2810297 RepID=UPI001A94FB9F|nr:preprotein translocase subunit SecE [Mycolicibacterium sp. S2-37]MBO0679016.1 preprotein translocase subunit SecE [Mycolicibacterium sp. S2-37]